MDNRPKCKVQTIKILGDNTGENLGDLGFCNAFLFAKPKAQSMKEKTVKQDFIKIKNFCSAKDTVQRMKRQATDWKQIFLKYVSDKELVS